MKTSFKPKIYIEHHYELDWLNRPGHLYVGLLPNKKKIYLGMVNIFSIEEVIERYLRKVKGKHESHL